MGGVFSAVTSLASAVLPAISGVEKIVRPINKKKNSSSGSNSTPSFNPTINVNVTKRVTPRIGMISEKLIKDWDLLKEKLNNRERGDENDAIFRAMLKDDKITEQGLYSYIDFINDGNDPILKYSSNDIKNYNNFISKMNNIFIKHHN